MEPISRQHDTTLGLPTELERPRATVPRNTSTGELGTRLKVNLISRFRTGLRWVVAKRSTSYTVHTEAQSNAKIWND